MTDNVEKLREFAREVLLLDIDADWSIIQELGKKHGLLAPMHIEKGCGEDDCACEATGNIPGYCWRWTDILQRETA